MRYISNKSISAVTRLELRHLWEARLDGSAMAALWSLPAVLCEYSNEVWPLFEHSHVLVLGAWVSPFISLANSLCSNMFAVGQRPRSQPWCNFKRNWHRRSFKLSSGSASGVNGCCPPNVWTARERLPSSLHRISAWVQRNQISVRTYPRQGKGQGCSRPYEFKGAAETPLWHRTNYGISRTGCKDLEVSLTMLGLDEILITWTLMYMQYQFLCGQPKKNTVGARQSLSNNTPLIALGRQG